MEDVQLAQEQKEWTTQNRLAFDSFIGNMTPVYPDRKEIPPRRRKRSLHMLRIMFGTPSVGKSSGAGSEAQDLNHWGH